MEVGHIIARLRTEKKLSQRDLAKEINVSAGVIGLWETNKRLPSYEFIIALADYFAISTDVFFEKDRKLKPEEYKKMEFPLQTQKMITIFEQFTELCYFGTQLFFGTENVGIILNKTTDSHYTMKSSAWLITNIVAKLSKTEWQIFI